MVVGWCFTKPRNYLQISTDIFIFDPGVVVFSNRSWLPDAFRPGLCCIYRAPFGVNYLQSGRIYFEVVQREVSLSSVGAWLLLAQSIGPHWLFILRSR
jgi:hypothetical protein